MDDVKRNNSVRSAYRKEWKKMQTGRASGASGDIYEPNLWYFENRMFLKDQELPRERHIFI